MNLAQAEPARLAGLIDLWWREAREHGVLPLDDRTNELFGGGARRAAQVKRDLAGLAQAPSEHSPHPKSRHYTYRPPMSPIPVQAGPRIGGRNWDLDATIERPAGAGGVLYATGNGNSGLSLFVQDDRLVFDYNCFGDHQVAESELEVPEGRSVVGVRFRRLADRTGAATLVVDGVTCGSVAIPFVMLIISSVGPRVGFDHGLPVSDRYTGSFPFEGTLDRVDIKLLSSRDSAGAEIASADARQSMSRQ